MQRLLKMNVKCGNEKNIHRAWRVTDVCVLIILLAVKRAAARLIPHLFPFVIKLGTLCRAAALHQITLREILSIRSIFVNYRGNTLQPLFSEKSQHVSIFNPEKTKASKSIGRSINRIKGSRGDCSSLLPT